MFPIPRSILIQRQGTKLDTLDVFVPCPEFEAKQWRYERFAANLTDWVPEFVFRPEDLPDTIESLTDVRHLMERAVGHLYKESAAASRGELGELILHVCCRQFFESYPAVSKLYYKTSANDVVKGFDLFHVRITGDEIELWLGEAKFWTDGRAAVRDAANSIKKHMEAGFMRAEKILLGGKISSTTPGYERLQWIFEQDTKLDQIFDRIVVPVLITYDSDACSNFETEEKYDEDLTAEVSELNDLFKSFALPEAIYVNFYVPMNNKTKLQSAFDSKLRAYRA